MKKYLLLWVMVVISIFSSGCASIICSGEKTININSNPAQANFGILDKKGKMVAQGTTPANVTLKRGAGWFSAGDYTITIEKAGYKKVVKQVNQGLEVGWYLVGNFVFGGLIGWVIIDPITGAMWSIEDVDVTLEPATTSMLLPSQNRIQTLQVNQDAHISMKGRIVNIN
ncbi:MAG: hypothetical protein JW749_05350 [Sedimentisphaerales bacterium]|nr:hypothetical protein [Sedimentisphaerales bacterium]